MTPFDEQKEWVFIAPWSPAPFAEVVASLGWVNPSFNRARPATNPSSSALLLPPPVFSPHCFHSAERSMKYLS